MAEQIRFDTANLEQISKQFNRIEKELQEAGKLVIRASNKLDWEVSSKEEIEGRLNSVSQSMSIQLDKLDKMSKVTKLAIVKTKEFDSSVSKMVSGIVTSILGFVGALSPIGKNSVINMLTGMRDTLTHTVVGSKQGGGGGSRGESLVATEMPMEPSQMVNDEVSNRVEERIKQLENEVGNNNVTSNGEIRYGGGIGDSWCVYFAAWAVTQAGGIVPPKAIHEGSTNRLIAWFQENGRWHNLDTKWIGKRGAINTGEIDDAYIPKVGDVIMVENDEDPLNNPAPNHTAVVYSVDETRKVLTTIEGNLDDKVVMQYYDFSTTPPRRIQKDGHQASTDKHTYIVGIGEVEYR